MGVPRRVGHREHGDRGRLVVPGFADRFLTRVRTGGRRGGVDVRALPGRFGPGCGPTPVRWISAHPSIVQLRGAAAVGPVRGAHPMPSGSGGPPSLPCQWAQGGQGLDIEPAPEDVAGIEGGPQVGQRRRGRRRLDQGQQHGDRRPPDHHRHRRAVEGAGHEVGHLGGQVGGIVPARGVADHDAGDRRGGQQAQPGPVDVAQHGHRVVQRMDRAPGHVLPVDGDLGHLEAEPPGPGQDLDVEGEPVDPHQMEEEPGRRGAEGLEPALGVLQVEPGPRRHQPVEEPSHHRPGGVGPVDHRVGQRPRPDGDVGGLEGAEQLRDGPGVDGHVGVHVGGAGAAGQADPGAHGGALAPVGRQADHPVVGEVGQEGPGGGRRRVGAPVVDDQELGPLHVDRALVDGGVEALHPVDQAMGLVEGGDDNGEFDAHGSEGPTLIPPGATPRSGHAVPGRSGRVSTVGQRPAPPVRAARRRPTLRSRADPS